MSGTGHLNYRAGPNVIYIPDSVYNEDRGYSSGSESSGDINLPITPRHPDSDVTTNFMTQYGYLLTDELKDEFDRVLDSSYVHDQNDLDIISIFETETTALDSKSCSEDEYKLNKLNRLANYKFNIPDINKVLDELKNEVEDYNILIENNIYITENNKIIHGLKIYNTSGLKFGSSTKKIFTIFHSRYIKPELLNLKNIYYY